MQTRFTPEQLRDRGIAAANEVLRTCVHCGFCTATCPTFVLAGDELDSPRGRIYLIKGMLEEGGPPSSEVVQHIDRCLSCLSCMTTCPSGVHYAHLVDYARMTIERQYRRPWHDRLLRGLLAQLLPYPGRFRLALLSAQLARRFAFLLPRRGVLARRRRPATSAGRSGVRKVGDGSVSLCLLAARNRCSTPRSTPLPSGCSPGWAARWWWPPAPAAAALSPITWGGISRLSPRCAQMLLLGRGNWRARGWTASSSTPLVAGRW
jgi:ferredoxin